MSAALPLAELLHGVSLEQYAGVASALSEGFPLAAILANEQIAPEAWPRAEAAWKARVAKDGAEGPIFAALCEKRAVAEDCLARGVAPIDSDLGAWMSFLKVYGAHPAPAKMLEGAGIGMNDLSRLQRRWARRMAEDTTLPERAAELAKKGAGPLPALRVDPAELKLFPWSKGRVPEPVPARPRVVAPADTSMAPGKLRLYSYVAIKARLAESPGREQSVLDQIGVKDFAVTDAGWQAVLRDDPELERDYQRLLSVQRSKIRGAAKQGLSLPKIESAPAPAAPLPPAAPLGAPAPPVDPPAVRRPSKLAGTALAVDVPQKAALPFRADAPPPPAPSTPPAPPAKPTQRRDLAGTSLAVDVPVRDALPFPAAPGRPAPPAPPPPKPSPLAQPAPSLTLEQHASLCCELAEAPARALETLARYHLTSAEKQAADRYYAELFTQKPGTRTAWDAAYASYRAWLQANRPGRGGLPST